MSTIVVKVQPPHDYGPGRVAPCGHRLCRYHGPEEPDACWPCERARREHLLVILECDPPASACREAAPNAAPAGRLSEEGTCKP